MTAILTILLIGSVVYGIKLNIQNNELKSKVEGLILKIEIDQDNVFHNDYVFKLKKRIQQLEEHAKENLIQENL